MDQGRVVAVIDVGSNSVRLLVARQLTPFAFEVVDEERYDARLGQGQEGGMLSAAGMERGYAAMRVMAQVARSHDPWSIVVAGTEALRRAPNAPEFVARVERETGLRIRILSTHEEAVASFIGTANSTAIEDGAIVDIGGGSLEVMKVAGRQLAAAQSVPLGAIYATERYLKSDPPAGREIRALRRAVDETITVAAGASVVYGVGGAVRNLARIVRLRRGYPLRRLHGLEIQRRELERIIGALTAVGSDARRKIPGVTSNRVDILPAAAIVLHQVLVQSGANSLIVTGQGLREGLVWQELRPEHPVLDDVRRSSVIGLARANGREEDEARPVVQAAEALFRDLHPLHELGDADLDLLLHAARLAGIGLHIDYYNRDRHAEYLVHAGDLHGFSHREITIIAALVRSATEGTPDLSPYRDLLQADDPRRATVLAAILGTARAAHRRRPTVVRRVSARVEGKTVTIALESTVPLDAEVHELEAHCRRLESVLKVHVRVTTE